VLVKSCREEDIYISKETFQRTLARVNAGRLKVSDGQDGQKSCLLLSTRRRRLSLGHILKRETCLEGQGSCLCITNPRLLSISNPRQDSRLRGRSVDYCVEGERGVVRREEREKSTILTAAETHNEYVVRIRNKEDSVPVHTYRVVHLCRSAAKCSKCIHTAYE
jgi:hypothetical protein